MVGGDEIRRSRGCHSPARKFARKVKLKDQIHATQHAFADCNRLTDTALLGHNGHPFWRPYLTNPKPGGMFQQNLWNQDKRPRDFLLPHLSPPLTVDEKHLGGDVSATLCSANFG